MGEQGAAQMQGNFFTDFWGFFETDVPNFIDRFWSYITVWAVKFYFEMKLESIKFAWFIAKEILESFQVGSQIASAANALPNDVKAALVDCRFFDGLNIYLNALVTRFILRII
ncbi:DUF2523 family protein [Pseudoalteromonas sp. SSM20]